MLIKFIPTPVTIFLWRTKLQNVYKFKQLKKFGSKMFAFLTDLEKLLHVVCIVND